MAKYCSYKMNSFIDFPIDFPPLFQNEEKEEEESPFRMFDGPLRDVT